MQFKGGLLNGVIVSVYGAASFTCLFFKDTMNDHMTMQKICWVLAAVGIIIAIYLLLTKEVLGVPIALIGLVHAGLAHYSEHSAMNVGCTGLAVITMVLAALMLERTKPMSAKT